MKTTLLFELLSKWRATRHLRAFLTWLVSKTLEIPTGLSWWHCPLITEQAISLYHLHFSNTGGITLGRPFLSVCQTGVCKAWQLLPLLTVFVEGNAPTNGTSFCVTQITLWSIEASNLISLMSVPCLYGRTRASWGIMMVTIIFGEVITVWGRTSSPWWNGTAELMYPHLA